MRSQGPQRRRGLSLIECLMLVIILGIIGGGAGQALLAVAKVPAQTNNTLTEEMAVVSKMEQMRSVSFANLPLGTAVSPYSDNVLVDVAYADPTGGNSPSTNWKQVTVRIPGGRQLVTMMSKP
ncbi:MAG: hypothetical protein WCI73_18815 [Phycisphaerae bacterium]